MGMKLKSGADLCGFQLINFCVQGEASAPSDAALGRKYFHTNATDDVATGISLLNRERIYLGEGAWRATAYLDDIAAIQTKLDMILGDVDLDGVIENMNEVIKFLEDNKDTENLMALLNNKLDKSGGGTITYEGDSGVRLSSTNLSSNYLWFEGIVNGSKVNLGALGMKGYNNPAYVSPTGFAYGILHEDNYSKLIGDYYLKSSGGTISNADYAPLTIHRNKTDYDSAIKFSNVTNSVLGYIGFKGDTKVPYYSPDGTTYNTLIHSGNIGEYALRFKDGISVADDNNYAGYGNAADGWPISGPAMVWGLAGYRAFLHGRNGVLRFNSMENGTLTGWKTIAFTDSDITGYSAGLKHSNKTVGATVDESGNIVLSQHIYYGNENTALKGNAEQLWAVIGGYAGMILRNESVEFKTSQATRFFINSSGNVTIGASDLAGTSAKLYVDGDIKGVKNLIFSSTKSFYLNNQGHFVPNDKTSTDYWWGVQRTDGNYAISTDPKMGTFQARYGVQLAFGGGNVGIGTTDPQYKLDVSGNGRFTSSLVLDSDLRVAKDITARANLFMNSGGEGIYLASSGDAIAWHNANNAYSAMLMNFTASSIAITPNTRFTKDVEIEGNLKVKGNIIATKEVSAGGAGTEESTSGSGSAEGVSEIFTPTSTSMAFDHNLGEDVIVQVYEKSGNVWNMVIVDTEITSATKVTLRFGKTETTQHKVVIMGV